MRASTAQLVGLEGLLLWDSGSGIGLGSGKGIGNGKGDRPVHLQRHVLAGTTNFGCQISGELCRSACGETGAPTSNRTEAGGGQTFAPGLPLPTEGS